jgi:hypothetical protein
MDEDWTSSIAAERMQLDNEFTDRVTASSFSNQQWSLVMTALEFEIENPEDPEHARIVPDTSNLPTIMPELDRVAQQGPMGGGGGQSTSNSGGILSGVKEALGLGGGGSDERLEEAETLATEYCERLQEKIEASGRWNAICELASSQQSSS